MLVAVDIGNTHTVVGLFIEGRLAEHWRLTSTLARTEDEIGMVLRHLFHSAGQEPEAIRGVAISSVVPALTDIYEKMSRRYLKKEPLIINHELQLGLQVKYRSPASVGADRLCNAVAGVQKYGKPLIVIDFGTATTFDCIDMNGDYLGGVIAPGIETSIHSLHIKAARLPQVDLNFPESVIGRSTDESIQSGILIGTIAMIEGMVSRINQAWGYQARVVATGGLSKIISRHTDSIEAIDPYLSLEGIIQIYEMNQK